MAVEMIIKHALTNPDSLLKVLRSRRISVRKFECQADAVISALKRARKKFGRYKKEMEHVIVGLAQIDADRSLKVDTGPFLKMSGLSENRMYAIY
jgi:hypothetical protein